MKILIIAKLDDLRKHASNNRINFLNYLSTYNNIILSEDKIGCLNNDFNILIYFCIYGKINIDCYDDKKLKNKKKYVFFEDFHNIGDNINFCKKYNINNIIIPQKHKYYKSEYEKFDLNVYEWGFYIDKNMFKKLNIKKEYDILLYGGIYKNRYKLRHKINYFLWKLELKGFKIKRIKFKGHLSKNIPRNNELVKLINQSKFCISTSSDFDFLVKKYLEIPFCGTGIIGDIPSNYKDIFNEKNIVVINKTDNDKKIYGKLLNVCKGKYDHLLNNNLSNKLRNKFSFENGYNDLISILEK